MNKHLQRILLYSLVMTLCIPIMVFAQTEVRTWNDLNNMRNNLSGSYILMNDLDENTAGFATYAAGEGWMPIGTTADPFTGTLDGQGYAIRNLRINRSAGSIGLFSVTTNATIKNLTLASADITATASNSGVLVGVGTGTQVENVHTTGSFRQVENTDANSFGGIVGRMIGGIITESSSGVNITTVGRFVGGLIGTATSAVNIDKSYYTGNITSQFRWIGGLVGQFGGISIIRDSYNTGNITGTTQVGGLIGYHYRASEIHNSYSIGTVTGEEEVGAISGFIQPPADEAIAKIISTYFNSETAGVSVGASNNADYDNIGRTTDQLKTQATFANWDFTNTWVIDPDLNNGYPVLQFQTITSIDGFDEMPAQIQLSQNFPNPFNPSTSIRFEIPQSQHVHLAVYSVTGQLVGTLVNETRGAGVHEVRFDAGQLSSGIYLYRLTSGGETLTKRMTLMK